MTASPDLDCSDGESPEEAKASPPAAAAGPAKAKERAAPAAAEGDDGSEEGASGGPSESETTEITGSEAIERLKSGERLARLRIVNLSFRGKIDYKIHLRSCVLVRPHFNAAFKASVEIVNCRLEKPNFDRKAEFEQGLNLSASLLLHAKFQGVRVQQPLRLDRVQSKGAWRMNGCRFQGPVRIWEGRFEGWLNLKDCEFLGAADFRSIHVEEGVSVEDCTFHDDFLFRGSSVCKKLDFARSTFHALVDLSKAKLNDYVYLEGVQQGPKQRFAFANALAERIHVRPEQLEGRLASEQAADHLAAALEFGLLKRIFSDLHRYESEDWAFHRFKICQRRAKPRSWTQPWTKLNEFLEWLFLDVGCGYGTNPFRAMTSGLVIILIFAALYGAGIHYFDENVLITGAEKNPGAFANRVAFGLTTSVAIFTAGFTGDQIQNARDWMLLPMMMEALLGTVLWGFFIVAFSRKVIR